MGLFERNLAKCGTDVTLQNRDIQPPVGGTPDFDLLFGGDTPWRAIIKTPQGRTFFDGVGLDRVVTHELCGPYLPGVTAETWVLLPDGRRLDVLRVTNCCEKDEQLTLQCTDRGIGEAAKA